MDEIPELLERFRRGPELVALTVTGASGAEFDFVPAPGKWSVRSILCHLADSEIVAATRFRRVIAEDNPALVAYDQDAWAAKLDYTHKKTSQALETFRYIRAANHELLHSMPAEVYERRGTHSERGPMTLLDLLRLYVRHAERHAEQIRNVRQEYKKSKERS